MYNQRLISWEDKPFLELFRLEEIDNAFFNNYQRYDFYQLLWFTGSGSPDTYMIDFREYDIEPNTIVIVFPGQIDKLDPRRKTGYLFIIENTVFYEINRRLNSDYLNGYFSNVFLNPDTMTLESLEMITVLLEKEKKAGKRLPVMVSYLEAFLALADTLAEKSGITKNRPPTLIAELMRSIDLHFTGQRETEFYARHLGMTSKRLNLMAKKGTGKSVKQLLQERLLLEIKREIHLGERNLKEIAFELGFNEQAYFTRFFKKYTGMAPSRFKEMVNKSK